MDVLSLAQEFSVSERTIRRDLLDLSCAYPIVTVRGRFGGGIKVADWFRLGRKSLAAEQKALLVKLAYSLDGEELMIMNSIISQFSGTSCAVL